MEIFSTIVIAIMVIFAIIAIIDLTFLKNKFGLGSEFKKGIELIGPLCLSIVGIIALVPEIAWLIERTLTPLYKVLGLDPSMAAATILAIDMGGYQLCLATTTDVTKLIGEWAGIVYGSMMGATVVFTIPVGLAAIKKQDISNFAKGILFGIAAIPFGSFVGGVMVGINALTVLINLIIPVLFSIIIILCLIFFQKKTILVFKWFSIFINVVAMVGLALAMIKDLILVPLSNYGLFDINNVIFFNILGSTSEGISVAGSVGLVLSGALPFVFCLNKALKKPFKKISEKFGISDAGITGFLLSMANNMATFAILDQMKDREKIVNVAFAVCGAFVIGDHLAFTAANAPSMIAPMMVSKLIAGIIAVIFAIVFTMKRKEKKEGIENEAK